MNLKIYYRSPVTWNIIFFMILSVAFIYLQNISSIQSSILDQSNLRAFGQGNIFILGVFGITILAFLYNFKKASNYLFVLSVSLTVLITIINIYTSFSKLALIILFAYMLITYYLYQFYFIDSAESYYNPQYSGASLYKPMLTKVKIEVYDGETLKGAGYLTNWSEEGCFGYFENLSLSSKVYTLRINFLDNDFEQEAVLVSAAKDKKGFGFKVKDSKQSQNKKNRLGWQQFYEIIEEMGFAPELLK